MKFKKLSALILGAILTIGIAAGVGAKVEGDRVEATDTSSIVFNFGANGSATHSDGSSKSSYSETVGDYTLSITGGINMYTGARDAKGNSCIKLGASSKAGGFSFTVPNDVSSVLIAAGKYKSNTTKLSVNNTTHTLTKNSNDGAYDEITVDTSSTKTVTLTTVSGGYRAMVNTIAYVIANQETSEPGAEGSSESSSSEEPSPSESSSEEPSSSTQPGEGTFKNTFEISGQYYIKTGDYYLKHNGTSKAPSAIDKANKATATVFDFTLVDNDTFTISTLVDGETAYLYSFNDNNGLRVGTSDNINWLISEGTKETGTYDIKNVTTGRYIALYNNQDFRVYTTPDAANRQANTDLEEVKQLEPSIKATEQIYLAKGMSADIKTKIYNSDVTNITYNSNSEAVSVDSTGKITANELTEGTTITSSITVDSVTYTDTTNVIVKDQFTSNSHFAFTDKSKNYDELCSHMFTRNDGSASSSDNNFVDIAISGANIKSTNTGSYVLLTNGDSLTILPKQNTTITKIIFALEANVTNFENTSWENAKQLNEEEITTDNAPIYPLNGKEPVTLSSVVGDFSISSLKIEYEYATPLTSFTNLEIGTDSIDLKYQIGQTLNFDNLQIKLSGQPEGIVLTHTLNSLPNDIIVNTDPENGAIVNELGEITINVSVTYLGSTLSKSFSITVIEEELISFTKVTEAPSDWSGKYLIVYENASSEKFIFSGEDKVSNYKKFALTADRIGESYPCLVTFEKMDDGYSINMGGNYLHNDSYTNSLEFDGTATANTVELDDNGAVNISCSGTTLKFNNSNDQMRFRYYKTGQQSIYLYKYECSSANLEYVLSTATSVDSCSDLSEELKSTINQMYQTYSSLTPTERSYVENYTFIGDGEIEYTLSHKIEYLYQRSIYETSSNAFVAVVNNNGTLTLIIIALAALSAFAFVYVAKHKQRKNEL